MNQLEALSTQLEALQRQLAELREAPPEAVRRTIASTAAERIRQLVLQRGSASMPELQRELKLEKTAAHYYAKKLAADGRIRLLFEPHEASHSLVLVAWAPERVRTEPKVLAEPIRATG